MSALTVRAIGEPYLRHWFSDEVERPASGLWVTACGLTIAHALATPDILSVDCNTCRKFAPCQAFEVALALQRLRL